MIPYTAGESSGIGHAAAQILSRRGAKVHILDLTPLDHEEGIEFTTCDVTSWNKIRNVFDRIGRLDMVFANAGCSEETDYFQDTLDEDELLVEP